MSYDQQENIQEKYLNIQIWTPFLLEDCLELDVCKLSRVTWLYDKKGPCHTRKFTGNQFQAISRKKVNSHFSFLILLGIVSYTFVARRMSVVLPKCSLSLQCIGCPKLPLKIAMYDKALHEIPQDTSHGKPEFTLNFFSDLPAGPTSSVTVVIVNLPNETGMIFNTVQQDHSVENFHWN